VDRRVKARGHKLEEKQLKFHIERYGSIAPYGAAARATASKSRQASTQLNDQRTRRLASYEHHGAGQITCAAAREYHRKGEGKARARRAAARAIYGACF
jgi:hypothetical protein